jgi:hypothetical protein
MRYSNRLFLYAPFVILLTIAAIAMLRWRQLATDWEAKLLAANRGREIAPGLTLHFASQEIGGFPFNLDVVLGKFALAVQSTRGPLALQSEQFAIHTLTYGRAQQIFEAAGMQTLTWTDVAGEAHRFVFVPGTMRASAIEKDGRLVRFDLDVNSIGSRALTGGRAQFHIRTAADHDVLDFAIGADDLRVRSRGAVFPHVNIEGRIMPAAPLYSLLSGHDEWRKALGDWRTAGGALRLDNLAFEWGASHLTAIGALAIDKDHRLSGELTMQLSGAQQWSPTRLVVTPFTSALQELANAVPRQISSRAALSLDIHNGAAIVNASGKSRNAGSIDPIF